MSADLTVGIGGVRTNRYNNNAAIQTGTYKNLLVMSHVYSGTLQWDPSPVHHLSGNDILRHGRKIVGRHFRFFRIVFLDASDYPLPDS